MKKFNRPFQDELFSIMMISLIIILSGVAFSQTWKEAFIAPYGSIHSIFFTSNSIGFISGDSCTVKKTYDGGDTWEIKYRGNPATGNLKDVFFVNESIGYSVGDYGTLLKTTNSGETWDKISINGITSSINAVHFIDESEGYIAAKVSTGWGILRTVDGGSNWTQVLTSANDIYDIKFVEGRNGIVSGNSVNELYYSNDGVNWNKSATPSLGGVDYYRSDMYGVCMVNPELAYAVGNGSVTLAMQPSILLKSTDRGATWTYLEQSEDNKAYEIMKAVVFKDPLNGLAIGGSTYKSTFLKTTDGGQNWIPYPVPSGGTLQTMHCIGDNVWVGGNSGIVLYSSDFGNTWELKTKIPSGIIYSIQSFGETVYAGGTYGLFMKSTDGGINWKSKYAVSNSVSPHIEQIFFLDENTGYIARWFGQVCKTTDGGETWNTVMDNINVVSVKNFGIHFVNEFLGFVVGQKNSSDIVYKTTDGGITWSSLAGIVQSPMNSVSFINENIGLIVAGKLRSVFTTDGGNTWNLSVFHSVPETHANDNLMFVTFTDGLNAIAVGDSIILKSSDGGANWNYVSVPGLTQYLTGASFLNANIGYALGRKEKFPYYVAVYKTEDGGNNWINIEPDSNIVRPMLTRKLTVDANNNLWISGAKTYTTANLVGVNDPVGLSPVSFNLFQNYPNPFNPSTKIKFNIAEGSLVSIKVFDVLGREVKALINEYKNSGTHELIFDGDDLTSGIYFYVLRSGANSVSKKMIIIK